MFHHLLLHAQFHIDYHTYFCLSPSSKVRSLEADIEVWKLEYISLIQSSIRFTGTDTIDDAELYLFGGDRVRSHTCMLSMIGCATESESVVKMERERERERERGGGKGGGEKESKRH